MSFLFEPPTGEAEQTDPDDLAAIDYSNIPFIPRRWLWEGYIPVGNPVLFAAAGGTGKGMLLCAVIARVVLGLPFPNEDQALRRDPGRAVYIAGTEDDPFEDLAPRLRAAIASAVTEFGLDPSLAEESGAIRYVHDLSEWKDGSPFEVPGDMGRLLTEVGKINRLGGPPVALVALDPLADLLGEHDHITSVRSARQVMRGLKQFARQADLALPIIHHLTKDGKVSGSPAVVDALRLAYLVERTKDDPELRVIRPVKANIVKGEPQQYTITGAGASAHAVFVSAENARTERVSDATGRAATSAGPAAGSMRARMAAVQADDSEGGPFRVLRQTQEAGGQLERSRVGTSYLTRSAARSAAVRDAGTVLEWNRPNGSPNEMAALTRSDGATRGYALVPTVKAPERVRASV
jgi:AAA domain